MDEMEQQLADALANAEPEAPATEPVAPQEGQGVGTTPVETPVLPEQPGDISAEQANRLSEEELAKLAPIERSGGKVVWRPVAEIAKENRATLQSNYQLNQENQRLQNELAERERLLNQYLHTQRAGPNPEYTQTHTSEQHIPEPDPYANLYGEDPRVKALNDKYGLLASELDAIKQERARAEQQAQHAQQQQATNQAAQRAQYIAESYAQTNPHLKDVPYVRDLIIREAQEIYNPMDYPPAPGNPLSGAYDAIRDAAQSLGDKYARLRGAAPAAQQVAEQVAAGQAAAVQGAGNQAPLPHVEIPTNAQAQEDYMLEAVKRQFQNINS